MPRFEPFQALRYRSDISVDAVSAPPYDVLSDGDADELRRRHPYNVVHVDVPGPSSDPDRYLKAGAAMREWEASGTLQRDPTAAFSLYRMSFVAPDGTARETVGVVGAVEVVDEGAPGVLAHERTTPKAKTDRLDLTRTTNANLSPIWGLSLTAGLTDLLIEPGEQVSKCEDEQGVVHTVERVIDPDRVAAIATAVSGETVLIADGHHRYAISRTFRDERRSLYGPGPADLTMMYVGELVESQLSIDAIHRVYRNIEPAALVESLSSHFDMSPAGIIDASFASEVVDRGALCFVHPDGTGTWMTPRPESFAGVRDLDGALLEHALTTTKIDVGYQHGVSRVVELIVGGEAAAAVLIRPTGIAEIRRTAEQGALMPPKSTFFTPKLRTGLVIRPMD